MIYADCSGKHTWKPFCVMILDRVTHRATIGSWKTHWGVLKPHGYLMKKSHTAFDLPKAH